MDIYLVVFLFSFSTLSIKSSLIPIRSIHVLKLQPYSFFVAECIRESNDAPCSAVVFADERSFVAQR